MAEASEEKFESRKGRPPKYPWEEWTDGGTRTLHRGEDFDADLISFRTMVHRRAREMSSPGPQGPKFGAFTHINKADQSIKIRFYRRDEASSAA